MESDHMKTLHLPPSLSVDQLAEPMCLHVCICSCMNWGHGWIDVFVCVCW